jgi:hypothetical protein
VLKNAVYDRKIGTVPKIEMNGRPKVLNGARFFKTPIL